MLIRFIFNSVTSSPFQVCSSNAISLCNTYLPFFHPNFSAICGFVQCLCNSKFLPTLESLSVFSTSVLYFPIQVWLLSHTLVLMFITLTSPIRLPSPCFYCINIYNVFFNILTNYFTVSYCIAFLFCIYNFRTKSQFHVKWICRNKFIILILLIIIIMY